MANSSVRNKKTFVIVGILLAGVVLALGLVGLGLGLRHGRPAIDSLLSRIDCYPEARWGGGVVSRRDCERRGCVFDPVTDDDDGAASCYVSAESVLGAGYSMTNITRRRNGFTAALETNSNHAQSDVTIQPLNAVLDVEYAGENVLHLKVFAIVKLSINHCEESEVIL